MVSTPDGAYIYNGIVDEYHLSDNGGLENIILLGASRRKFSDDKSNFYVSKQRGNNKRWQEIPSQFLIIPGSKIINVNLNYYTAPNLNTDWKFLIYTFFRPPYKLSWIRNTIKRVIAFYKNLLNF